MSITATTDPGQPLDREIGESLRRLRRDRGLSLTEMAARTSLSIGFLSQIERGLSSPTLRVLVAIADALGVGVADIFPAAKPGELSATILRRETRSELPLWRSGIRKVLLAPHGEGVGIGVYLVEIEPGAGTGEELYTHKGQEAGVVMEGAMLLQVEGESWTLREGDGFSFLSSKPHRFANAAEGVTKVFWVNIV